MTNEVPAFIYQLENSFNPADKRSVGFGFAGTSDNRMCGELAVTVDRPEFFVITRKSVSSFEFRLTSTEE